VTQLCECGCGAQANKRFLPGHNIRVSRNMQPPRTHGESKSPEYHVWKKIIARCHNPQHKQFANYGGRGIKVCDRWRSSLQDFITDVGRRHSSELTFDRINNDGDYEPGNVRWATWTMQANNRRMPRKETYPRRRR
jgi:hypothetical protein